MKRINEKMGNKNRVTSTINWPQRIDDECQDSVENQCHDSKATNRKLNYLNTRNHDKSWVKYSDRKVSVSSRGIIIFQQNSARVNWNDYGKWKDRINETELLQLSISLNASIDDYCQDSVENQCHRSNFTNRKLSYPNKQNRDKSWVK